MGDQNVAIAQGDLYPNGVIATPPNADVQATVRPAGTFFQKSPGYESIRPGKNKFQKAYHGLGIHFTPMRFAENVEVLNSLPLLVDASTSASHVDIAELPGSEDIGRTGDLRPEAVAANKGVKMSEDTMAAPTGGKEMHRGTRTLPDMGDRDPGRPLTQMFHGILRNPAAAFRDEYREDPVVAVGAAGVIVGLVYFLGRQFESSYRGRSRGGSGIAGAAAPVAAVPVAATDTAGSAIKESAEVVNEAATAAGEAVKTAVSAAGDTVEAAGEAVEKVTDSAGDAVTGD